MLGLQKVAEYTGESFSELQKEVSNFTKKGLNPADIQTAYKNLMAYGFSAKEATKWIEANADAAAVNRQANYGLSESIRVASEGIKNENSIMSDATGITKNIAKMYKEYAESIGKTVETLSQAEKVQAVMNGTLAESAAFQGSLAEQMDSYAGAETRLAQATSELTVAFGESVADGLKPFLEILTEATTGITGLIEALGPAGTILIALALATTGVLVAKKGLLTITKALLPAEIADTAAKTGQTVATTGLAGAFTALNAAMGPVGWAIVALTAGVAAYGSISKATSKDIGEMSQKLESITEKVHSLNDLSARFDGLTSSTERTVDEQEELKTVLKQLDDGYGIYAGSVDKVIGLTDRQTEAIQKLIAAKKEQLGIEQKTAAEELKGAAVDSAGKYLSAKNANPKAEYMDVLGGSGFGTAEEMEKMIAKEKAKLEDLKRQREQNYRDLLASGIDPSSAKQMTSEIFDATIQGVESQIQSYQIAMDNAIALADQKAREAEGALSQTRVALNDAINGLLTAKDSDFTGSFGAVFSNVITEMLESGSLDEGKVNEILTNQIDAISDELSRMDLSGISEAGKQVYGAAFSEMLAGSFGTEGFEEQLAVVTEEINAMLSNANLIEVWNALDEAQKAAISGGIIELTAYESALIETKNKVSDLFGETEAGKNIMAGLDGQISLVEGDLSKYSAESKRAEEATKKVNKALEGIQRGGQDAADALSETTKEGKKVSGLKSAFDVVEKGMKSGQKNTKDYADALKYLSDNLGMDTSQIEGDLNFVSSVIWGTEADFLAFVNTIAASSGVTFRTDHITGQIRAVGQTADANSAKVAGFLNNFLAVDGATMKVIYDEHGGGARVVAVAPKKNYFRNASTGGGGGGGGSRGGGGGGGSRGNTRLEKAMAEHEHLVALDKMTTAEQIANLRKIMDQYAKSTAEKRDLIEQIYDLEKQRREELLEDLNRTFERARDYGAKNEELQIKALENYKKKYKLTADEIKKIDQQIYDLRLSLYERQASELDNLANGVLDALRNKYEQERDDELKRIEESKQAWNDWAKERTEAVKNSYDEQIKALDDLVEAEDRAEKDRKELKKINDLKLQLEYERDLENRERLIKEIEKAEEARSKRLRQLEISDQKKALQEARDTEIAEINMTNEAKQKALDEMENARKDHWDKVLSTENLKNETEKLLVSGNQKEIQKLLKSYNKDYDAIGRSWGQQLVDAFGEQLTRMTERVNGQIAAIQKKVRSAMGTEAIRLEGSRAEIAPGRFLAENVNIYNNNLSESTIIYLLERLNRELALRQ